MEIYVTNTAIPQDATCRGSTRIRAVLVRHPLAVAVALNSLVGLAVVAYWFTPAFLLGRSGVFLSPDGDFETYLTGAQFAIHDSWHFPLFETHLIERSVRQSLAFFDLIPLYALVAKLVYGLTGYQIAYYAWWYATVVTMQPVAFTLILWFMGVRNSVVMLSGGALALLVPHFLFRIGHTAIFGSFTYLVAMALYFAAIPLNVEAPRWRRWVILAWPVWLCLIAGVNLYLLALGLVFFGAALCQNLLDDRSLENLWSSVAYASLTGLLVTFVLYAIGDFIPYRGGGTIGSNSMNILSPFVPQFASLFPSSNHFVDATGGQAEGYNYLGVGIMLLVFVAVLFTGRSELRLLRRHPVMTACLVLLTLFAVSNKAYLGTHLLWSLPAPEFLGNFRNTGRFIWPVTYFTVALSLFSVAKMERRRLVLLLAVVIALQWADTRLLASGFYNIGHAMDLAPREDDERGLRTLIAEYAGVHVEPDYGCNNTVAANKYIQDLAWYAALESRRTNATYQARPPLDWVCTVQHDKTSLADANNYMTFTFYDLDKIPADLDRSQCALRPGVLICLAARDRSFKPEEVERLFSPTPAEP